MKRIVNIIFPLVIVIGLMIPLTVPVSGADPSYLPGRWHFDGNANDTGDGPNNSGTLYGDATITSVNRTSLVLDGNGDYMSVPDHSSLDIAGEFTVEAWVKLNDYQLCAVVSKGVDGQENYELLIDSQGLVETAIKLDTGRPYFYSWGPITKNVWHHLAVTYKSGEIRMYVDGKQAASAVYATGTPATNDQPLLIGSEMMGGSPARFFPGSIDEVRIWNKALSQYQLGYYSNLSVSIDFPSDGGVYNTFTIRPDAEYTIRGQVFTQIVETGYNSSVGGPYTYRIEVTDYWGATAFDEVTYTVTDIVQSGEGRKAHFYGVVMDPWTWADAEIEAMYLPPYTPSGSSLTYYPHLASITSAEEQALMATLLTSNQSLWIGGTDAAREGTWKWSTGERVGRYFNWDTGEPSPVSPDHDYMMWQSNKKWRTCNSSDILDGYIVEYEIRQR